MRFLYGGKEDRRPYLEERKKKRRAILLSGRGRRLARSRLAGEKKGKNTQRGGKGFSSPPYRLRGRKDTGEGVLFSITAIKKERDDFPSLAI